jgi:hypothetical protein
MAVPAILIRASAAPESAPEYVNVVGKRATPGY